MKDLQSNWFKRSIPNASTKHTAKLHISAVEYMIDNWQVYQRLSK